MQLVKNILETNMIQSDRLRRLVPAFAKQALKRRLPFADFRSEQLRREAEARFGGAIPFESSYESQYPVLVGIFFDRSYTYAFNVAACRELGVRFKVVDLTANDWVERLRDSGCDGFLVTPPHLLRMLRGLYEERIRVVALDLGIPLCPTYPELYLWESKRRMRDWLIAHDVPHPATWVFLDCDEAMRFCRETSYPVVCKTDFGAASSGIIVVHNRRSAERLVTAAFSKGLLARSTDPRNRESGFVLFQEFVPHDYEWRVVRIGDDFMCRRKVRVGDFASGSGSIGWAEPLPKMLDFARAVTDKGGFTSMSVDMFENTTGRHDSPFLVNELQAIIGFREVDQTDDMGRWRCGKSGEWTFEKGCFHRNALANLRVKMLLQTLETV